MFCLFQPVILVMHIVSKKSPLAPRKQTHTISISHSDFTQQRLSISFRLRPLPAPRPEIPQDHGQRNNDTRNDGQKHQSAIHPPRRVLQRIHDQDENPAEQLAPTPARRARDLGADRPGDLGEQLEHQRHEAEAGGAEHTGDGVGCCDAARTRREDEGDVHGREHGDAEFDEGQAQRGPAVEERGCQGGKDEADDDEKGAGDAGFGFGEGIG